MKEAGLRTYAFISSIIPNLVDVKALIAECRSFADYFWFEVLNLRASGPEFTALVKTKFPASYAVMTDMRKFDSFVQKLKCLVDEQNVEYAGIEVHTPSLCKHGSWEHLPSREDY